MAAGGRDRPAAPPLITVIVATYNGSGVLPWALESVRGQDFEGFEAWVVGDASSDDSEAVVAALDDPRFQWRNLARNSGSQAAPNNEGLRLSRGRYVAYLGHDDLWFPWHLSALARAIEETNADLVHSLCALIGPEGAREATGPAKASVTYEHHFVPPSSWLHRAALRGECGTWGAPDRLPLAVDREYLRRVHRAGKRIAFLPRLSVLKFPSMWWGHYRAGAYRPQPPYLQRLGADPADVEREVLQQLAIEFARERYGGDEPWVRPLKRSIRMIVNASIRGWGADRWPLPALLRWQYQRYRRHIRGVRGLDTAPASRLGGHRRQVSPDPPVQRGQGPVQE